MKKKVLNRSVAIFLMVASIFTFSGCLVETCVDCNTPPPCVYGPNGVPGPAYFSLDWTGCCAPTYVWTNNTAIPPTFQYGTYYNSFPGTYQLYYEGRILDGCCYTNYYWNVDFVVWINVGTAGGCGYAGANGLPSYLMIVCGPTGPGNVRTNKLRELGIDVTVISENANEVIVQYVKGDINVRIAYHRLASSRKKQLDPSGTITANSAEKMIAD